ncbi:unnamed protein product [Nippostrongylus brasiliensis]|uniref:WW domain-binding protein 4 (inferred by orthology to a human protein) n=1 Tax=Nippostrongylus brasiliensis TaxID=27835 RepID=A0A0N4Y366_NIPBR|nr:unnamed protein product [Nippostrongylus brasiliensis]
MADVWKSQDRKFCTICKVWFGDNRASIEFHERGRKHKDALAAKLRELGRASKEKEREQSKMSSALAAMEAAALKSMREHGEALEQGPALPSTGLASRIFDPRQMKDVGLMAREMAKRKNEMKELHNQKRSSAAAPPVAKYFKRDLHTTIDYSEFTAPIVKEEQEPVAASSSAQGFWVEADAGDGRNYYFHMYTGESTWDRPESFLTAEQYGMYLQSTGAALKTEIPDVKEEECSSHPSELPVENTAVEEASGSVAVKSEPCDDDMIDFSSEIADIPLPETDYVQPTVSDMVPKEALSPVAVEPLEAHDSGKVTTLPVMPSHNSACGAETFSGTAHEAEAEEEEGTASSTGPFGSWTRVKKTDNAPVFSPLTAKYRADEERERKAAEEREKQAAKAEPVIEFTEKTSAVLTKKVKGPIEFKKKTAVKNVRQRVQ